MCSHHFDGFNIATPLLRRPSVFASSIVDGFSGGGGGAGAGAGACSTLASMLDIMWLVGD